MLLTTTMPQEPQEVDKHLLVEFRGEFMPVLLNKHVIDNGIESFDKFIDHLRSEASQEVTAMSDYFEKYVILMRAAYEEVIQNEFEGNATKAFAEFYLEDSISFQAVSSLLRRLLYPYLEN